ncbi:MAG: HAD family hydrolase [SAR324 cluster bacterium]|nr:HAD family hydrolase [SAR324 cluster bacterium]
MKYKAVLFDLDGTLLDTLEDLGDTVNQILSSKGFPTHPIDAYRYFVGNGAGVLMKRALPDHQWDEQKIDQYVELFNLYYDQNWKKKTKPYHGVEDMLEQLVARKIPITVLSNKPDEFTQRCVRELLSKWKFDVVFGHRKSFPHKPDPSGALEIAKILNLDPKEFIYLGDTATDMKTAKAAKMFAVGVQWGFRPIEELQANGADAIIKKPQELLRFWD